MATALVYGGVCIGGRRRAPWICDLQTEGQTTGGKP